MERKTRIQSGGTYPVALEVEYKVISTDAAETGSGRTCTMTSREVSFVAERRIEVGTSVELSVAWPVLLDDRVRLQLLLEGYVVRSEGRRITARFSKYNFRTRGVRSLTLHPGQWTASSHGASPNATAGHAYARVYTLPA